MTKSCHLRIEMSRGGNTERDRVRLSWIQNSSRRHEGRLLTNQLRPRYIGGYDEITQQLGRRKRTYHFLTWTFPPLVRSTSAGPPPLIFPCNTSRCFFSVIVRGRSHVTLPALVRALRLTATFSSNV